VIGGSISYYRKYNGGDLYQAIHDAYLSYINIGVFFGLLMILEIQHQIRLRRVVPRELRVSKKLPNVEFHKFCRQIYDGE
jgi:hypothetical protein